MTTITETVRALPQRRITPKIKQAKEVITTVTERCQPSNNNIRISRRRRGRGKRRGMNAPVALAQPSGISQTPTEVIKIRGSDRFAHISDISILAGTSIAINVPITVDSFKRLEGLSNNYQNYMITNLTFKVCPQVSTATNGGYVVGYSDDPDTIIPEGENGLNAITALSRSQTKKWWEDSVINTVRKNRTLFTQTTGEKRFYADGLFVLGVDGKSTTTGGSLTIYAEYEVHLMKPVLRIEDMNQNDGAFFDKSETAVKVLWESGDSNLGYLAAINSSGKVEDIEFAFPRIKECFGDSKRIYLDGTQAPFPLFPGNKSNGVSEYAFQLHYIEYIAKGIDSKSMLIFGVNGTQPAEAYVGTDYSTNADLGLEWVTAWELGAPFNLYPWLPLSGKQKVRGVEFLSNYKSRPN